MLSRTARHRLATEDRLDSLFQALSDRTRRALLVRLEQGPRMITELAKPLAMSLPAVSRHLRVLQGAGLITRTVNGRVHLCSLNAATLKTVDGWLKHYRQFWEASLESLARHVESNEDRL